MYVNTSLAKTNTDICADIANRRLAEMLRDAETVYAKNPTIDILSKTDWRQFQWAENKTHKAKLLYVTEIDKPFPWEDDNA